MKLFKGDKIMQSVDKDQVDICLSAGWSRTVPVKEEVLEEEIPKSEKTIVKPPVLNTGTKKPITPRKRK